MATYRLLDDFWSLAGLTACTSGSAPDPTLCNGYGKPLFILLIYFLVVLSIVIDRYGLRCSKDVQNNIFKIFKNFKF